jgi:transmembrane protein 132
MIDASSLSPNDPDYKPPVPPHRNIGVTARISPPPRQPNIQQQQQQGYVYPEMEGQSWGEVAPPRKHHHHHHHHHHNNRSRHSGAGKVSRVGRRLHVMAEPAADVPPVDEEGNTREDDNDVGLVFPSEQRGVAQAALRAGGAAAEVKRANIVGNPMFSEREQDELMGSDVGLDLNLGMDYEQILEYFDNLKESNA